MDSFVCPDSMAFPFLQWLHHQLRSQGCARYNSTHRDASPVACSLQLPPRSDMAHHPSARAQLRLTITFFNASGSLVDCKLPHLGVAPLPRQPSLLFTSISRSSNVPGCRNGHRASGGRSGGACRGHGLRLRATGEGCLGDQNLGTRLQAAYHGDKIKTRQDSARFRFCEHMIRNE